MKRARADRIMWEVGEWRTLKRKPFRRWRGRLVYGSRAVARQFKLMRESIRRLEAFYIGDGE